MLRLSSSAKPFVERETLPFETTQLFGAGEAVLQEEARHLAPTHFGIDDHRRQPVALPHLELGRHDLHLALHAPPVEEILHLAAGQVEQHAALLPDGFDEHVRQ